MDRRVARNIKASIQNLLWGRAGGRCEYCNHVLYEHALTKKEVNTGQKAHIWAFSEGGTRGNLPLRDGEINDITNLILLCYPCHRTVDRDKAVEQFTAAFLRQIKAAHEARIELVTGIDPDCRSHIVTYGSNVGDVPPPPAYSAAARALFVSSRYPTNRPAIELGMINSWGKDHDDTFWRAEEHQLTQAYAHDVSPRFRAGEIEHLSLFAIAPQPLLILLGTLITDIPAVDVYQLHRDPKTWQWLDHEHPLQLTVKRPTKSVGPPALVLSISGTVTNDRIHQVLTKDATIWRVTVREPHNDLLRSREQLQEFRQLIRPVMDEIKAKHGQSTLLHVFPAMPVSMSVELGRARQPKADLPWRIYDQVNKRGGFIPAVDIPKEINT